MRRVCAVVASLILGTVALTWGHTRNNELFFAVQFPDGNVPVADGNLSDWAVVPDVPYVISSEKFVDMYYGTTTRGEINVSDMAIRALWGWNDNNNRLYLMAEVFDDRHIADRDTPNAWWADDAWEIYVNPQHLSPTEQNYTNGLQSWNQSVPIASDNLGQMLPAFAWRENPDNGIHWKFGWSFEGEMYGESTYFYEMWVQPYDFIPEDGSLDDAIRSDLEEEDIVHFSMAFDDDDDGGTQRTNFWSTSDTGCCTADSDLLLNAMDEDIEWGAATAVQSTTWGRIKSQFISQ